MNNGAEFLIACVMGLAVALPATADTRPPLSCDRYIRPILSDKFFRCHGPDALARQADLRPETREGLSAKILVRGKPDESEIVTRIYSEDDDVRMPPPDS